MGDFGKYPKNCITVFREKMVIFIGYEGDFKIKLQSKL